MPQRLLRPQIRQSERWNRLSYFEQSFYVRLLTLVDDYGRYEAHPVLLAHEAFPFGDPDGKPITPNMISNALTTFSSKCCQMLSCYQSDGKMFLQLSRWKERPRSDSKFPNPADICQQMIASPPSPSPSPSPAPEPQQAPANAEIPTWEEVSDHAKGHAVTEKTALAFFNHHQGNALWFNGYARLIDWRHKLISWSVKDREKSSMPAQSTISGRPSVSHKGGPL